MGRDQVPAPGRRAGKGLRRADQDRRRGARQVRRARGAADLVRHHRRELRRRACGLGALSLAKDAKKAFEQALELDAKALDGSAYTSLGSLYYQVPGWPIGFGNDDKARELLEKAIALNPEGIDSNYFLGDFLYRQGDTVGARRALQKALRAPARPERALADEGRRKEIESLLAAMR